MKSRWIDHKGKRILLCDYSGFGTNHVGMRAETDEAFRLVSGEPPSSVLTLTDIRGNTTTDDMLGVLKVAAGRIGPLARRRAVVGVTGLQKLYLHIINTITPGKSLTLFDDLEAAKDWLVKEK